MFISPVEFAKSTEENYELIRNLCLKGKIKCEITKGNHIKIYKTELEKYLNNKNTEKVFITKEQYETVIRENERLKLFIKQLKDIIENSLIEEQ